MKRLLILLSILSIQIVHELRAICAREEMPEEQSTLTQALFEAIEQLETYRTEVDETHYPEDRANLIAYLQYYQQAGPSWNFTVTPPTVQNKLSPAANTYIDTIREIAGKYSLKTAGGVLRPGVDYSQGREYYNLVLDRTQEAFE